MIINIKNINKTSKLNIIKGYLISAMCEANPGENETVSNYMWRIDTTTLPNNLQAIQINTSSMNIGLHEIGVKAQNSCGNTSVESIINFNLIEVNNMQKIVQVIIGEPTVNVNVVMDLTATVNVTVKDPNGVPLMGATCQIETITATTNSEGIATLNNVPYGTRNLTVSSP